jgi:hypothetical protein
MRTLLSISLCFFSAVAFAKGGIISGGPPLKLKASCESQDKNVSLSVAHSPLTGTEIFAEGPFGRVEHMQITQADVDGQPLAFTTERFKLTLALTVGEIPKKGTYQRPAWLEFRPGDAIFSESLTCTVYQN